MSKGTAIFITGPTASGKTSASIQVASQLATEVISADSRQLYRELDVGVARPTSHELEQVPHHLIASHSILEPISTFEYEQLALSQIQKILTGNSYVVVSGGTGLYIKAITEGLDDVPSVSPELENEITEQFRNLGLEWLQAQVKQHDPVFYEIVDEQNPRRLLRALGVIRETGQPFSQYWKREKTPRTFRSEVFSIKWEREELYDRINRRVDLMFEMGLQKEVEGLKQNLNQRALQTVGYREFIPYFEGKCSLEEVKIKIKQHTRNYAKRQETWIKNQLSPIYVSPETAAEEILQHINRRS